jgi:hypothetical protein
VTWGQIYLGGDEDIASKAYAHGLKTTIEEELELSYQPMRVERSIEVEHELSIGCLASSNFEAY